MAENGNGNRIISLDQVGSQRNAKDDHGRVLRHNATIMDAHQIAIEEGNKVAAWHMQQIPNHVAKMIQDALLDLGLAKVVIGADNVPMLVAASDPRQEWVRPIAPADPEPPSGDTSTADTSEPAAEPMDHAP
jgi:hypothetical protein